MTDRGQLDLISLLVNLFLSLLLVHHSYTFIFSCPPPLAPFIPFPPCLLYRSLSPSRHLSRSSCFALLPPYVLSLFHLPLSFTLYFYSPVCKSITHLFGGTLSFSCSARHPGPFIISLLVFSLSSDNFRSSFSSIIMRFRPNHFDLVVTLSLLSLCLSTCVSVSLQGWPVAKCCVCVRSRCSLVIAS